MREETGLEVDVGPVIDIFDRITRDVDGRVQYHYVLVDYLCRPTGGALRPGSDVDAAAWASASELSAYHLAETAMMVIARGLELTGETWPLPAMPGGVASSAGATRDDHR
jgi:ADP-ribose pyrophosphatase YjhB (NUDIX family)